MAFLAECRRPWRTSANPGTGHQLTETVAAIVAAHRAGTMTPAQTVARSYQRIRDHNDPAVFISLRDERNALAEAEALAAKDADALPLLGVPVAVKDNIDARGMPTTAACPAFSYMPAQDSTAVARLRAAGAIIIGKTNLDQFATGLVGVRSPYGIPVNPVRSDLIPGGSSSGSAVAVSAGLVPLALGTDTAGSGRVPAMLNNIVGLKPSLGLISNAGLVPACRTLDCISVFSLTVDDAMTALVMTAVAFTLVPGAAADDVYHSEHMALEPVGSAPLRTGFVENIHANGPTIYAQEIYVLNGAGPSTDYEVHLIAYPFRPGCEGTPTDFGFASLTTNRVGNGRAKRVFRPADVPAELRNATHGIRWEIRTAGTTVYETQCTAVTLD